MLYNMVMGNNIMSVRGLTNEVKAWAKKTGNTEHQPEIISDIMLTGNEVRQNLINLLVEGSPNRVPEINEVPLPEKFVKNIRERMRRLAEE